MTHSACNLIIAAPKMRWPNTFRDAALIYNPRAGRKRWRRERDLACATRLLEACGIQCSLLPTTGPGSATELARREVAAGRDLIIVCGGDGTVNEAVNGMAGSRVPLALLPAGTGNVLAKELGLSWDIHRAAEYIPRGEVRRIALGRAGDRHFICMAGAGADAAIVNHLKTGAKTRLGLLSFWLEGFHQLFTYPFSAFRVEVDGESFEAAQLIVSRTRHYGGPVMLTRRADLFQDRFEIVLFPRHNRFVYLLYFLAQLVGELERFPGARFLTAQKVQATTSGERVLVQMDGEAAGALPAEFRIVPDALSLVVPSRAGK